MDLQQLAFELFDYDCLTGKLYWKKAPSNRCKVGEEAGTLNDNGYRIVYFNGARHRGHRLIWLMHTGSFPTLQIDHINGIRDDNRIENLREVTNRENSYNLKKPRSFGTSGYLGVTKTPCNRYMAQIVADGRYYYLGNHATPEEAHAAYLEAKRKLHSTNTL